MKWSVDLRSHCVAKQLKYHFFPKFGFLLINIDLVKGYNSIYNFLVKPFITICKSTTKTDFVAKQLTSM